MKNRIACSKRAYNKQAEKQEEPRQRRANVAHWRYVKSK